MGLRLGGIYALERIAWDSRREHWSVMEVLAAYVREAIGLGDTPDAPGADDEDKPGSGAPPLRADVEAILGVFNRRRRSHEAGEDRRLNLRGVDLRGYPMSACRLGPVDLTGARLDGVDLSRADLRGANLTRATLRRAILCWADLSGAQLAHAELHRADFRWARLPRADLTSAKATRALFGQPEIISYSNTPKWLLENLHNSGADLRGARLAGADLRLACLQRALLNGVTCGYTSLAGADLSQANLRDSVVDGADLDYANLWRADLSGARLEGVTLYRARLQEADLRRANLARAYGLSPDELSRARTDRRTRPPERPATEQDLADWERSTAERKAEELRSLI